MKAKSCPFCDGLHLGADCGAYHKAQTQMTKRDTYTQLALAQLAEAQRTRQHYDDLPQAAIAAHGDVNGTPTSGVYNPSFPDAIKNELRTLAHNIGAQVGQAYAFWRNACVRQMRKLGQFLGADPYSDLLWNTERL